MLSGISSTFAAQCPAPSDISHQAGFQWTLSESAYHDGWQVSGNSDANSTNTAIPLGTPLDVESHPAGIECVYMIGQGTGSMVILVNQMKNVDVNTLPVPPFKKLDGGSAWCETNSTNVGFCQWNWQGK